jgi:hypothetical protein
MSQFDESSAVGGGESREPGGGGGGEGEEEEEEEEVGLAGEEDQDNTSSSSSSSAASPEAKTANIKSYSFKFDCDSCKISGHFIKLDRSLFLVLGDELSGGDSRLDNLVMSMPTRFDKMPLATSLIAITDATTGLGLQTYR